MQTPKVKSASDSRLMHTMTDMLTTVWERLMQSFDIVLAPLQRLIGKDNMGYVFLLPNLLIFGIFVLLPMGLNFAYAATGGTDLFLNDRPYVGTDNFENLFECEDYLDPNSCRQDIFWRAIINTGVFVVFQVSVMVLLSLITALILNRKIVARGFFRSVFFYPVLLSPVVVGLIWKWILQRNGILNVFAEPIFGEKIAFLLNTNWQYFPMFWVIFVSVWALMGFYTLILLAGLQSIPAELYEASAIDGAGAWDDFWHITLPLLTPTLLVVTVLALIRSVQAFDQIYILTGGGPGTATTLIVQYIYDTGVSGEGPKLRGLASAASVVLGVLLMIFTLIQLRLGSRSSLA